MVSTLMQWRWTEWSTRWLLLFCYNYMQMTWEWFFFFFNNKWCVFPGRSYLGKLFTCKVLLLSKYACVLGLPYYIPIYWGQTTIAFKVQNWWNNVKPQSSSHQKFVKKFIKNFTIHTSRKLKEALEKQFLSMTTIIRKKSDKQTNLGS